MPRLRTPVGAVAVLLAAVGLPLLSSTQASAAPAYLQWDFNSDGLADLAVGAAGKTVGSANAAGTVSVFMATGPGTYGGATQWTQGMLGGAAEEGDQFGYAMTSGDYDGDSYADLAVSANREGYTGPPPKATVGIVTIIWGGPTGLTAAGARNLKFDVNGVETPNSFAGDALASGDMDNDGAYELAVGAPGVELTKVYKGQTGNRAAFGTVATNLSEYNLPGTKRFGDLFGETLVMGDFNNDNRADLVIGAPYDSEDRGYSSGAVVVVPGGAAGADVANAARWSPDSAGISSVPHTFTVNDMPDSFGRTLAAGDLDGDGTDDLAVGIPGSTVGKVQDAGAVNILYGSASGISNRNSLFTQDSPNMPGASATGDMFGASLDAGHAPGAKDLLAIGSAKEVVWVLPGNTGTGSQVYTQDTDGILGVRRTGSAFGAFVRFLDPAGNGNEYLAVGAPGLTFSSGETNAGMVFVLPSSSTLPTGTGSKAFEENSPGVDGERESGDAFGWLGDSH